MQSSIRPFLVISLLALVSSAACSRKELKVPVAVNSPKVDNFYMDLQPDWKLRIIVPLFKSGGFSDPDMEQQAAGAEISVHSDALTGYTVSSYAILGGRKGRVRLKFLSSDVTRDGKTVLTSKRPSLPFQLPRGTEHIRLIYLVRVSRADHNMAVVASKSLEALNSFTARLQANPSACISSDALLCSWIPTGVAVRPERQ